MIPTIETCTDMGWLMSKRARAVGKEERARIDARLSELHRHLESIPSRGGFQLTGYAPRGKGE